MGKFEDLTGRKFGRLTVISRIGTNNLGKATWLCKCDCGKETVVTTGELKSGNTKSCGCYNKEKRKTNNLVHGKRKEKIYKVWANMKARCTNESVSEYKNYGGRGITVCDEWRNSFIAFYEWAMANGYNENLQIDRKDVNGNYEPSNCRWVTRKENCNNRTNSHYITHNGETHTISEWARIKGIKRATLSYRINVAKWDAEKALEC